MINCHRLWETTKEIFEKDAILLSLSELTPEHHGRLAFSLDGTVFETCFLKKDPSRLFVFLSGPGRSTYTKPKFLKKSYSVYFEDSCLYIDDPCNLQKQFAPTFFWGNNTVSYMDSVLKIVRAFQNVYSVKNKDIIFLGESNTGFVALYCAAQIPYSQCIALAPQVNLRIYLEDQNLFDKFNDMFGYDFQSNELEHRIDITDLLTANTTSKFFIISNITCYYDITQMSYLFKKLAEPEHEGLNIIRNFTIYISTLHLERAHFFIPTEGFCRYIYNYLKSDKFDAKCYRDFDALSMSLFWYRKECDERKEYNKMVEAELVSKNNKIKKLKENIRKLNFCRKSLPGNPRLQRLF